MQRLKYEKGGFMGKKSYDNEKPRYNSRDSDRRPQRDRQYDDQAPYGGNKKKGTFDFKRPQRNRYDDDE